jgi:hypothetical protein
MYALWNSKTKLFRISVNSYFCVHVVRTLKIYKISAVFNYIILTGHQDIEQMSQNFPSTKLCIQSPTFPNFPTSSFNHHFTVSLGSKFYILCISEIMQYFLSASGLFLLTQYPSDTYMFFLK